MNFGGTPGTSLPNPLISSPLFVLRGADLQASGDQVFTKVGTFNTYAVNSILALQKTGAASALTTGGIYAGANKTGNVLILSTQTFAPLSGARKYVGLTLGAILGSDTQIATPFLNMTLASVTAATCDILIYGYVID